MAWTLEEAVSYYQTQGAPRDQIALTNLLREIQQECGGSIPAYAVGQVAQIYGIKDSFLLALIKRLPSLRLRDTHELCICAGPNCGKHAALAAYGENLCAQAGVTLKFMPCMRMCGKGPNIKFDGKLYHKADEDLLRKLIQP